MDDTNSSWFSAEAPSASPEPDFRESPAREIRAQLVSAWRWMLQARCAEALHAAESIAPVEVTGASRKAGDPVPKSHAARGLVVVDVAQISPCR